MRKKFGMLALVAAVGMGLFTPDEAFARRARRARNRGGACCTSYCNPCGATVANCGGCGGGCSTGAPASAPSMSGPTPAAGYENAPPPPAPAPGA